MGVPVHRSPSATWRMRRLLMVLAMLPGIVGCGHAHRSALAGAAAWPQLGRDAAHSSYSPVRAGVARRKLADVVVDPFVQEEMDRYGGRLAVHYQTPLIENDAVYMEVKTGHWSQDWSTQSWSESAMKWTDGQLMTAWSYPSEWVPPPPGPDRGWEPEFQPAAVAGYLYLPGPRGSVDKVA